jgi:ABC-type oligopeptide transport system substrate-binding subunit
MLVHDCRVSTSAPGRCLRWASLALAALLATACTGASTTALRFALSSSPVTLDPRFATDAASTRINRLLYQQLVDFNERFEPIPALATWERVSYRRYRSTLTSPGASSSSLGWRSRPFGC